LAGATAGNALDYLAGLFARIHADIERRAAGRPALAAANLRSYPTRAALTASMSGYFEEMFHHSLSEIYLDFVRQRALEHNAQSRLGHPHEAVAGVNQLLFAANAVATVDMDVSACKASGFGEGSFGSVPPFASRMLRVKAKGRQQRPRTSSVFQAYRSRQESWRLVCAQRPSHTGHDGRERFLKALAASMPTRRSSCRPISTTPSPLALGFEVRCAAPADAGPSGATSVTDVKRTPSKFALTSFFGRRRHHAAALLEDRTRQAAWCSCSSATATSTTLTRAQHDVMSLVLSGTLTPGQHAVDGQFSRYSIAGASYLARDRHFRGDGASYGHQHRRRDLVRRF